MISFGQIDVRRALLPLPPGENRYEPETWILSKIQTEAIMKLLMCLQN